MKASFAVERVFQHICSWKTQVTTMGSELWIKVGWGPTGDERFFLVKSVRDGKTRRFSSQSEANAEVVSEDTTHAQEILDEHDTNSAQAEELQGKAWEAIAARLNSVSTLWRFPLRTGVAAYFGTDQDGSLATTVSTNPATLVAVERPSPPTPGLK